jgi:inorganic triphosphatase YgiF
MPLTDHHEIETKLQLPGTERLAEVPGLIRKLQGDCSVSRCRWVTDIYCDSPGCWFYRAGFASRIRHYRGESGAEWTLKSLRRPRGGIAIRQELTERLATVPHLPTDRLPGRILRRQFEKRMDLPRLIPLFTLVQRRRVFEAIWPATGLHLEVSLDVTRLAGGQEELAIVELELMQGEPGSLKDVTRSLRKLLGVRTAPPSKFAWAVRQTGSFAGVKIIKGP